MDSKDRILLNDVFAYLHKFIIENNLQYYVYDNNDDEIYFGINAYGLGIRLVNVRHPFLMLFVGNNEISFHLSDFSKINEITLLINNYYLGNFYYKLDENGRLRIIEWNQNELSRFNQLNYKSQELKSYQGINWLSIIN